jgi:serine/threonine protein kinase
MVAWDSDNLSNQATRTNTGIALALGQVIDERYEIIEYLGAGGMCTVYMARQLQLDKTIALKILHPRLLSDDKAIQRFQREAVAVSLLNHPNIVSVLGFGVWNSQPYMAAELIDGISLAELLQRQGHLEKQRALTIFNQILDALNHAHERGIIHRDLKPSNVMLADNDFVKLVDFGIAKVLPESGKEMQKLTQTDAIFGTLLYMSPEQCLGYPVDARADIYAMGCLMYEVLTGVPPLQAETAFALVHKQLTEQPADAELLDRELAPVIMQCLEKDPNKRPQSAASLKDLLACPPCATLPLPYKTLKKQRKQVRWLLPSLLVAAMVASAGLGWMLYRQAAINREPSPEDPVTENCSQLYEEAMSRINTDDPQPMRLFDKIVKTKDKGNFQMRYKAIAAGVALAARNRDMEKASELCDRFYEDIKSNFPTSLEYKSRYWDLVTYVASAKHDRSGEELAIAHQLQLFEQLQKSKDHFKDEESILTRTYDRRAEMDEAVGDFESAEKDYRRAFAVLDLSGIRNEPLFTHDQAGEFLFDFLLRRHRTQEARLLLQHMEDGRKNWDSDDPGYPGKCQDWSKDYSKVGEHEMAIQWVTRAIDCTRDNPADLLRFRATEYDALGDGFRAEHDRWGATLALHGQPPTRQNKTLR